VRFSQKQPDEFVPIFFRV